MKLKDVPFNMNFTLGDDLRETPEDSLQMRQGLDFLIKKLDEENSDLSEDQIAMLKMTIAGTARIMGDLEHAEQMLVDACSYYKESQNKPYFLAAQIRLAIIYQWQNKYSAAEEKYIQLLETVNKLLKDGPSYLVHKELIVFNLGRCAFEQKFYQVAMDWFLKCLDLRLSKGDVNAINQIQGLISQCQEKLTP